MNNTKFVEYQGEFYAVVGISDGFGHGIGYFYHLSNVRGPYKALCLAIRVPISDCFEVEDPQKIEMLQLLYEEG